MASLKRLSQERWQSLWSAAGALGPALPWFEHLVQSYSEPHRAYHSVRHIAECLEHLDQVRALTQEAMAVEFALWFHDAIYDPKAADNEERSAELAVRCLGQAGVTFSARVRELILVTKHLRAQDQGDSALIADIDLASLGYPWERFMDDERAIRSEFGWIAEPTYRSRRMALLKSFLARDPLYQTRWFQETYEYAARANLQMSLDRLRHLNKKE